MKRIYLFSLIMLAFSTSFQAQPSKVTTAIFALQDGNLAKAREAIDLAVVHNKTLTDPKAWYYRGLIYKTIYLDTAQFKDLDSNAIEKAHESFLNAVKYDKKDKYKGLSLINGLDFIYRVYYLLGDDARNANEMQIAYENYKIAHETNIYLLNEDAAVMDTTVYFLEAYAADRSDNKEIAGHIYSELLTLRYQLPLFYELYAELYLTDNIDKALEILGIGRKEFPNNDKLRIAELNAYLSAGRQQDALDKFETAAKENPDNADIQFALGTIYDALHENAITEKNDSLVQFYRDKMVAAYLAALKANPDHYKAGYNLGVVYFNEAIEVAKTMNNLPLNQQKEYQELMIIRNEKLEMALPYLEESFQTKPDDIDTMTALKEIYVWLKMYDKAKEMQKLIDTATAE